jgi:cytochrome oxidase Cu insertion factor (SCO1/SenC/PrrC family)
MSRWNLLPLGGFVVVLAAAVSYFTVFAYFPVTRDVPWLSLLLMAAGLAVSGAGTRRAYAQPGRWFGKASASLLSVLSVLLLGLFVFYTFSFSAQLPESAGAPQVGGKAPDFALPDQDGKEVKLSELVASLGTEPGKDRYVLLVFYRGYW